MKIVKKIFYTIFGLLMATTLALIGVILYAEFTGNRFSMDKHTALGNSSDEESRLAYDENGNLAELPGSAASQTEQAAAEPAPQIPSDNGSPADSAAPSPGDQTAGSPESINPGVPADSPEASTAPANTQTAEQANTNGDAQAAVASPSTPEDETERPYIMDTGSGLFHTDICTDAAAIAVDQRSERTTARNKILDAGYQPCPNCNP